MKQTILTCIVFLGILMAYSCNNNTTEVPEADASTLQTRALPQNGEEPDSEEDLAYSYIVRKWELGDEYIDLETEGSFEAVLEGKHIQGRWGLSYGTEEKKMLKLIGNEDGAARHSFNKTYELIDVSYERLVAIDAEGNKINFFPEK